MNKNGILRQQQRAVMSPVLRPFTGSSAEYEAVVVIENANHPDALQTVKELKFGERTRHPINFKKWIEPGDFIQAEGKETITAFT